MTVGDFGTVIRLTVAHNGGPADLSGAAGVSIYLISPQKKQVIRTATFTTDGTNGQMEMVVEEGDLSEQGSWGVYGFVQGLNGFTGFTSRSRFDVLPLR
jgi:hypothetical protein